MKSTYHQYKHLTQEERYYIECRKSSKPLVSNRKLGRELKRYHTTIGRELERNFDIDFKFYSAIQAEVLIKRRRKQSAALIKLLRIEDKIRAVMFSML